MTPDSADLLHIMQCRTTTMRTDINSIKSFSTVYVLCTDACKYSSLPLTQDKPEIAQSCPNSFQVISCRHKCSKFTM